LFISSIPKAIKLSFGSLLMSNRIRWEEPGLSGIIDRVMGLFDFLKKKKPVVVKKIPGPTYLEGLTEIVQADDILQHEWRRKLKAPSGQTHFNIRFYGQLHPELKDLIVRTDFAPILVYAVDPDNGQEFLIFDGCKYGYDALFCDSYSKKQIKNRPTNTTYQSTNGDEVFDIIISIYNGIYFAGEFADQADSEGYIELVDGKKEKLEVVERNAFDTLQVYAINESGEVFNIIAEELS
jgi:hypothetical protein